MIVLFVVEGECAMTSLVSKFLGTKNEDLSKIIHGCHVCLASECRKERIYLLDAVIAVLHLIHSIYIHTALPVLEG